MLIIWVDKFVASKKYNFYNFYLDDQNHWCLLMALDNKHWILSEKHLLSLLAHFYHKTIDSFTLHKYVIRVCQQLRPISNAWENSKLFPFRENFKNVNLPTFLKERMASIILYLNKYAINIIHFAINMPSEQWYTVIYSGLYWKPSSLSFFSVWVFFNKHSQDNRGREMLSLFNSSLPLSSTSQTLKGSPGNYCR